MTLIGKLYIFIFIMDRVREVNFWQDLARLRKNIASSSSPPNITLLRLLGLAFKLYTPAGEGRQALQPRCRHQPLSPTGTQCPRVAQGHLQPHACPAGSSWTLAAPHLSSWSSRTCVSFWHLMTSCRRPFISTIFSTMYFSWRHAGGPSSPPSSPLCISHDVMQEALHLHHLLHYVFLMTSCRRPFISTIFSTMYFSWCHTGDPSSPPSSPLCISHDVMQEALHLHHLLHYVFLMMSYRRPFISTIFSTMYFSWHHAGGPSSQPSSPLCISHDVMQETLHLNHLLHYVFLMTSCRRPFISTIFSTVFLMMSCRRPFISTIFSTMYFSWRHTGGLSSQPSSPLSISRTR